VLVYLRLRRCDLPARGERDVIERMTGGTESIYTYKRDRLALHAPERGPQRDRLIFATFAHLRVSMHAAHRGLEQRERDRQTDRQTDRKRERERERQTDRQDRERERETEREREREEGAPQGLDARRPPGA